MKVKSTEALRYFIKTQKGGDFDRRTDSDFIGSYHGSPAKGVKGFFKIYHGIKEDISSYLQSILKIAEDGQAVYEFIQNAVDCNSSQFWIFYNDDYFLAINNGESFKPNEIASILNIAQSDKRNLDDEERCDKIGRFGIGFKLVHRLVGENDGSNELTKINNGELKGPVLFSWSHYSQMKTFMESRDVFEQVKFNKDIPEEYHKSPWLFKILLTNFPASPGEVVKDFNYKPFTPLPISEINEFKDYLKSCLGETLNNGTLLSKGSMFFIKLGKGKAERLRKESVQLEAGVNYSMHFFNKLQKITINDIAITKKPMEWLSYEIKKTDQEFIDIDPEYSFCPIKISVGFTKENKRILLIKDQPNFYKYFPLGDETNKLGLILHSDAFDIESNRRKLHNSTRNEKLINAITNRVIKTLDLAVNTKDEKYKFMFLSILLSEANQSESNVNTLSFISPLKDFIKCNVVTNSGTANSEHVKIKAFKYPIELKDIGFENYQWFAWNDISFKEASDSANSELGIEKWGLRHLLSNSDGQNIASYLKSLKQDQYIKFIEELKSEDLIKSLKDKLIQASWLLTQNGNLVSIQNIVDGEAFLIKDLSKEGANIFQKISKEVICSELNFAYSYILDVAGPIETKIEAISDFLCQEEAGALISSLTFKERAYLNDLVNKDNQAVNFVPLFKSKKQGGSLKPLNSLISNSCVELHAWLSDFVIDNEEEKALLITFQTQLLKEKDFLEKLFCNTAAFNEVTTNLNSGNIEEFYAYLLKLLKNKSEETKIDFSKIPWVFIESSSAFALASTVYWPESMTKLSATKYASVKSIFETITEEKLPHHSALQIKAPFVLGGKELKLTEITPKPNSFDVITLKDFLDWAEANGEKDLLNHFSFSKIDDKFSIGKVSGTLTYYTTDETLINFIESSAINTQLGLFPKELYTKERNKIGLLESVSLLKYLIENGQAITSAAKFIQETKDSDLSKLYLELLSELNIDSLKTYTENDAEFKILKLVSNNIIDDGAKLDSFREKIILDGVKLLEKAVSADVRMYDDTNGKFVYQFQSIELSDILPAYKGKTYPVSEIVELFIEFRDNESLKKIFKAKGRGAKGIYKDLIELNLEAFNAAQTFFLSFYQSIYPTELVLKDKIFFTLNSEVNSETYEKELHLFLDYCVKENSYIGFVAQGLIPSFNPMNLIATEEYAIESEKLPKWLNEWHNKSDTENKNLYLKSLGINNEERPIVLYRKAIKGGQTEPMAVNCALVDNDLLLINSLTWLSIQNTTNDFIIKKEVLLPLYQKLLNRKVSVDKLLIPTLQKLKDDSYLLQRMKEGDELHYVNEGWGEYKETIFSVLKSPKIIIDDVLPKAYRDTLKVIEKPFQKLPDIENLKSNSYQFDEEYYQNWDLKSQYNIQIYKGTELPFVIMYNDSLLANISAGVAAYIGNVYYAVESIIDNLFTFLAQIPEFKALQSLRAQKQLFDDRKETEKWKVEFTEKELEALKKLFGDEIPPSFHKDLNVASLVTGLIYLNSEGFDITEAEANLKDSHNKAQLFPVISADKTKSYTVMSRSAKAGLLYITARAWNRLDDINTWLFVTTGKKETDQYLFKNKQDVMNISVTDFQVFRVESESKPENIDDIITGKFDLGKIWLIFKMADNKSYNSIFGDGGGIRNNEENPDYENVNTSENSPY